MILTRFVVLAALLLGVISARAETFNVIGGLGGGSTSFANPTGTVGLTTVNGAAATAMRSDAAPPLSQAIAPTWTGIHIFSNATGAGAIQATGGQASSSATTGAITISGTGGLGVGGNIWSGGSINLPNTTSSTVGVFVLGGEAWHNYPGAGYNNIFIAAAGNFTGGTGGGNVGLGLNAMQNLTTGAQNVAIGPIASNMLTSGSFNFSLGYQSGYYNQTGNNNINIGYQAGLGASGQSPSQNIFIGSTAGTAVTTAVASTAIGYASGIAMTTAVGTTIIGANAGTNLTTGNQNTLLGYQTGGGLTTGSFNTVVGSSVSGLSPTLASSIILADGSGNIRADYNKTNASAWTFPTTDLILRHIAGSGTAPTNSACAGFALDTGSSDLGGRVTFTSATSCAITFGTTFANPPFCWVVPGSAVSTAEFTRTTSVLTATFGTAQTSMTYGCHGV